MHIQEDLREWFTLTERNVFAIDGDGHICIASVLLPTESTLSTCYPLLFTQQGQHPGLCICRSKIHGLGQACKWLPAGLFTGGVNVNVW